MKLKLISLPLFSACCTLATMAGARDLEERAAMPAGGRLTVANLAGEVVITGWDKNEVWLKGRLGDRVERVEFSVSGDEAIIELVYQDQDKYHWERDKDSDRKHWRGRGNHDDYDSDLEIFVPSSTSIEAETVSADIEVAAIDGEQSLSTVSGDIDTVFASKRIELTAISGDIDAIGTDGDHSVVVSTVSGDVNVQNIIGVVRGSAVSGDLTITGPAIGRAELKIVSGSLDLDAKLTSDSQVRMESVSGDIRLRLAEPVSARFDMQTFSGDIDEFYGNRAERTSRYSPGERLRFTQGGGDATVNINTMSGDIESGT